MHYSENDKDRLLSFYSGLLEKYGPHDPKSLSFNSAKSQRARFSVLAAVGPLEGRSLLDIGCGFGDLYEFLRKQHMSFTYAGIDINPHMIAAARAKHPQIHFDTIDFGAYAGDKYDYVVSSGALTFKVPDYKQFYFALMRKMFECSTVATAFNILNGKNDVGDDTFATYTVPEVYEWCSTFAEKIVIRQDYLPHDFTVYLYH